MATRVEAHKSLVQAALEMAIASTKRAMNTSKEPEFKPVYERKLAELQTALGTLTEVK